MLLRDSLDLPEDQYTHKYSPKTILTNRGMKNSTIAMVCNTTGPVDAAWGARWGLIDIDWSGGMDVWAAPSPMIAEEFMVANCDAIAAASGGKTACWVYVALKYCA